MGQFDEDGNPVYPPVVGHDDDGNPIYPPVVGHDSEGNPIYPPVVGYDKDGEPIYGTVSGYDEDGNPIYTENEWSSGTSIGGSKELAKEETGYFTDVEIKEETGNE
jgi:hypothetical protein